MITYVNTVLVSNDSTSALVATVAAAAKGKFLIQNVDTGAFITTAAGITSDVKRIRIGMGTGQTSYDQNGVAQNVIRWSNIINRDDVRSFTSKDHTTATATSEDAIFIDLSAVSDNILAKLAEGGKRFITRLTFKDLPTRYRKWTESYEYVTQDGDTKLSIATNIAKLINKQWKRARVVATVGEMNSTSTSATQAVGDKYYHADANWNTGSASNTNNTVCLVAMKYNDDDSVNTINKANKVRFNANIYFTDPAADGWESHNKNYPTGVQITKFPGYEYPASAKLVRDRENESFGYMGILNRGEGTWPIIQPAMRTSLSGEYNAMTLEFENMYRAADDIFRKTKQTLEIYTTSAINAGIVSALATFASAAPTQDTDMDTKDGQPDA